MSSICSDCFNGCAQIVSDKCVKYTGVDNETLGIRKGDSLSYVESALVTFLSSTLDGLGIKPDIDSEIICTLVSQYLPVCDDITIVDISVALIKAACDLQTQLTTEKDRIDVIEANYTLGCLTGVSTGDGTHSILQATITKLCSVDSTLTALAADLETNYVKVSDLDDLIQAYIDSQATSTNYYLKMIPYVAVPYFGSLSGFDITGAGTGDWINIYLCNGANGTPDLRGRVLVGAIAGVGGGVMSSMVDPGSSSFNPNYALNDNSTGSNSTTVTVAQLPVHTHTASATISPDPHNHALAVDMTVGAGVPLTASNYLASNLTTGPSSQDYTLSDASSGTPNVGIVGDTSLTSAVTVDNTGSGDPIDNKIPTWASYFIIYLP